MTGRISQIAGTIFVAAVLLVLGSINTLSDDQRPVTNVKDTKGESYSVLDLYAKYTPGGMWIGSRPERTPSSLRIVLSTTKNRVNTTERIEFPFAKINRIVLKEADLPTDLKSTLGGAGANPLRIELRDGTVVLLGQQVLIQIDADGKQIKKAEFDSYSFKAGVTIQGGHSITLDGFGGHAKTGEGKEGDFWIPLRETASIDFE